jgi:hypothetical protein
MGDARNSSSSGRQTTIFVEAKYFSWNSGDNLQMSQVGLLRTLLYDALKQSEGLAERCFPERWEMYPILGVPASMPLSEVDLRCGLDQLITARTNTRFAFFIDSLDEFSGSHDNLLTGGYMLYRATVLRSWVRR